MGNSRVRTGGPTDSVGWGETSDVWLFAGTVTTLQALASAGLSSKLMPRQRNGKHRG